MVCTDISHYDKEGLEYIHIYARIHTQAESKAFVHLIFPVNDSKLSQNFVHFVKTYKKKKKEKRKANSSKEMLWNFNLPGEYSGDYEVSGLKPDGKFIKSCYLAYVLVG